MKTELKIKKPTKEVLDFLHNPDLLDNYRKEIQKIIVCERLPITATLLLLSGRLVKNPADKTSYNLAYEGAPGIGKTTIMDQSYRTMPPEICTKISRISETALTYFHANEKEWNWDGQVLYLNDVSEKLLNSEVIKIFLSGDGGRAVITIKNKPAEFWIKGKPVVIITAEDASLKKSMGRRLPLVLLNESALQTAEILKRKSQEAETGRKKYVDFDFLQEVNRHLKQVRCCIPFASWYLSYWPSKHIISRTTFSRFNDYVLASAALYQYQRKSDERKYIIATGQDYDNARLVLKAMRLTTDSASLSHKDKELLAILRQETDYTPDVVNAQVRGSDLRRTGFTVASLMDCLNITPQAVGQRLSILYDHKLVEHATLRKSDSDKPPAIWWVTEKQGESKLLLPSYAELEKKTQKT